MNVKKQRKRKNTLTQNNKKSKSLALFASGLFFINYIRIFYFLKAFYKEGIWKGKRWLISNNIK